MLHVKARFHYENMNRKYYLYILSIYLLICYQTFSQKKTVAQADTLSVRMIAKATDKSIMLRWAPTSSKAWLIANKQGYIIERILISKGKKLLRETKKEYLSKTPIKPLPLDDWEEIAKKEKFAPIVLQALYGENFVLKSQKNDVMSFINAAKEQENRFSFTLFACDMSWQTALAAGLAFEDKRVEKDEKYLYKVYPSVTPKPGQSISIDTAIFYVGLEDFMPTPRIRGLEGEFSDKKVLLKWNQAIYGKFFTAYQIERSEDGKMFLPTSEVPFISPEAVYGDGMIYRTDSLPQNEKTYYFRVKGITPFGELSQASDTVSGKGYIPLNTNPVITKAFSPDNRKVFIQWEFPETQTISIEGFDIEKSEKLEGFFQPINKKKIDKQDREYVDIADKNSNYYRVKAVGKKKGEYAYSFPILVQLVDSTAPAPPQKLVGSIDSNGVVKITWQIGTEPDLYGYRVYRSNSLQDEFSQITKEAITKNTFTDTIEIKTLSKKIYYRVVAVDTRFNPSDFSEVLEIKKPDVIPPNQAVFYKVLSSEKGVELFWEKSAAEDLEAQVLYRKDELAKDWTVIAKFDKNTQYYLDESGEIGKMYFYTLISVDDSGLESKPSTPVQSRKFDKKQRAGIEKLQVIPQKENKRVILTWKYPDSQQVDRFLIYKAKNKDKISLLSFAPANAREFTDEGDLKASNTYSYKVKVVYKDGTESSLSAAAKIDW